MTLGLAGRYAGNVGGASVGFSLHAKNDVLCLVLPWKHRCGLHPVLLEAAHPLKPGLKWTRTVLDDFGTAMMRTLAQSIKFCLLILMAMGRMSSWLPSWALTPQTRGGLVCGVISVSAL